MLVRRLAGELQGRLRGARVSDVGLLPDGRMAFAMRSRGDDELIAVDAFGSPPNVCLERPAVPPAPEPGFARAAGDALKGMTLRQVVARVGDRLLRMTFGSQSRFGVGEELELFIELVPRFGNIVLVKRDRVVAALKEFSPAENHRRTIAAGFPYAWPPLPNEVPQVPRLLQSTQPDPAHLMTFAQSEQAANEPLFVYRREGRLVQAHLLPLDGFEDAACTREPSLLALLAELARSDIGQADRQRAERRRRVVINRLDDRRRKLDAELATLERKRLEAGARDQLRAEGQAIFAGLHQLSGTERDEAKDRAAKLFARYKKLGAAAAHIDRRQAEVRSGLEAAESLRWEAERVSVDDVADLEAALTPAPERVRSPQRVQRKRKRAPLAFAAPDGSRILVGRSPIENAELTFKVARPFDLWFHARGIPGAHVILARDDRTAPAQRDVAAAAALAAYHSKGRESGRVAVDYAPRKFVHKQRDAAPGLVWYTNAQTIAVAPSESAAQPENHD